jgi:hypothetical protein
VERSQARVGVLRARVGQLLAQASRNRQLGLIAALSALLLILCLVAFT